MAPAFFFLTPVLGGPGAPRFPITEQRQVVGRAQEAQIVLPEPTVSREHAAIHCEHGVVQLQDLGSRHGTFVNSKRIQTMQLKAGDLIVFGLSLVLRLEQSSRPIAATPTLVAVGEDGVTQVGGSPSPRHITGRHELRPRIDAAGTLAPAPQLQWLGPALQQLAALGAASSELLPALQRSLQGLLAALDEQPHRLPANLRRELIAAQQRLDAAVEAGALARVPGQPLLLLDAVRSAANELAAEAARHHVHFDLDVPHELQVRAQPSRLRAALTNLLANAVLASPPGAPVTVEARPDESHVVLTISDLAAPVPPEVPRALIDPLTTLSDHLQPLALSLLAARHTLRPLGATVELDPLVQGPGRCVRVLLPRS